MMLRKKRNSKRRKSKEKKAMEIAMAEVTKSARHLAKSFAAMAMNMKMMKRWPKWSVAIIEEHDG